MFQAAAVAAAARCGHVLERLLTSYPPSHSSACCCSLLSNAKCLSSRGDEAQHLIGYYDRSGQLVLKRMSGGLAERLWSAPVRIEHQIAREVFLWGGRGKEKFCTFNWNYSLSQLGSCFGPPSLLVSYCVHWGICWDLETTGDYQANIWRQKPKVKSHCSQTVAINLILQREIKWVKNKWPAYKLLRLFALDSHDGTVAFGFTISTGLAPVSVFVTLSPRFQWLPPTPVLLTERIQLPVY